MLLNDRSLEVSNEHEMHLKSLSSSQDVKFEVERFCRIAFCFGSSRVKHGKKLLHERLRKVTRVEQEHGSNVKYISPRVERATSLYKKTINLFIQPLDEKQKNVVSTSTRVR